MNWLGNVYPVVILLGIMILIHELGHYWAALSVGIRVDTFSIGFGPRLFGFRRGETDYRISAIPLGGYVRMAGELPGDESSANDPRSFLAKARWQRAIVVLAGPVMNIVLAIGIMTALYIHSIPEPVDPQNPVITSVNANSPAAAVGVQAGDRILAFAGHENPNWEQVVEDAALNGGHTVPVVLDRRGHQIELSITPELDQKLGFGIVGWNAYPDVQIDGVEAGMPAANAGLQKGDLIVGINKHTIDTNSDVLDAVSKSSGQPLEILFMRDGKLQRTSALPLKTPHGPAPYHLGVLIGPRMQIVKYSFFPAVMQSIRWSAENSTLIFKTIGGLVQHRVSPTTLQGPIQIAKRSTEAAHEGVLPFMILMAIVSLNLAVLNLLPIPILDGGTLLVLLIEMIMQREVSIQVKETALKLGFVFLMIVVVFVIYNDLMHT